MQEERRQSAAKKHSLILNSFFNKKQQIDFKMDRLSNLKQYKYELIEAKNYFKDCKHSII